MLLAKNKLISGLYAIFIAIYLAQIFLAPISKTALIKYNVDTTQLRLLGLTVAIPYIVIWMISLVGYLRLHNYAKLIKSDKDGKAFTAISSGVLWLSLWLPISTLLANFFSEEYMAHPSTTANLVRLSNYVNLIILFVAFHQIYKGTNQLVRSVKKPLILSSEKTIISYIAFSALYVLLTLHDSTRQLPSKTVAVASYYQPDWLLVITIVIPRLIYWFWGVQAVQNLYQYRTKVSGKLYRQALNSLAIGLSSVVAMTIVLRCLQSFSSSVAGLNLAAILVVVYVLLILISVGYIFIAKGAKALQQLEEL